MVLLNDKIVKDLHLLNTTKKIHKNSSLLSQTNVLIGGILGICLLLSYFIINKANSNNQNQNKTQNKLN
jgi:hypothetical protein